MAARASNRLNLADVCKQLNADGSLGDTAEILMHTNEINQDIPWIPANQGTANRVTMRSTNPTVDYTRVNKGTAPSKGTTEQRLDTIGLLVGLSEVDNKLKFGCQGNFESIRKEQDDTFLESMAQKFATTLIYGNEATNDMAFTGFMPRLATIAGGMVVDAGGTGTDNRSILVVDWHERYCAGIFPSGTKAGIDRDDKGEQRVTDADSNPLMAFVTEFQWAHGLTLKHKKHVCRIANVDASAILDAGKSGYTGPDLTLLLIDAFGKMTPANGATRMIYAPPSILTALDKLALTKANLALRPGEWDGQPVTMFRNAPIRRVDEMETDEARVV